MKISVLAGLAVSAIMLFNISAYATETGTMSCREGIVSIGDTAGAVVSKCGQPVYTAQRERKDVETASKGSRDKAIITVTIDDWTFNFGPNQFQYRVLLENGRVTGIESLDYGY